MHSRIAILVFTLFAAGICWGQGAERINRAQNPTTIIGPRNLPLHDGAQALLAGDIDRGVRLTHEGLELAQGRREQEAALSNLCAGYIKLGKYDQALPATELNLSLYRSLIEQGQGDLDHSALIEVLRSRAE